VRARSLNPQRVSVLAALSDGEVHTLADLAAAVERTTGSYPRLYALSRALIGLMYLHRARSFRRSLRRF